MEDLPQDILQAIAFNHTLSERDILSLALTSHTLLTCILDSAGLEICLARHWRVAADLAAKTQSPTERILELRVFSDANNGEEKRLLARGTTDIETLLASAMSVWGHSLGLMEEFGLRPLLAHPCATFAHHSTLDGLGFQDGAFLQFGRRYLVGWSSDPLTAAKSTWLSLRASPPHTDPVAVELLALLLYVEFYPLSVEEMMEVDLTVFVPHHRRPWSLLPETRKAVESGLMRLAAHTEVEYAKYLFVKQVEASPMFHVFYYEAALEDSTPCLLGLSREGVVVVDASSGECILHHPLHHLYRFACRSDGVITFDFGDHRDAYFVVHVSETSHSPDIHWLILSFARA